MPFIRCPSPSEAIAAYERLRLAQDSALFLFFGSEDPATGVSWCPDCVLADPVLRATIAAVAPELTVYECPVGPRAAWKGVETHPYRQHPAFRVQRIPTLVHFQHGLERGRLVEGACADAQAIRAFLA
ncbi:MAG: DUF953 domain-containing protein [Planctomycetota bacterium]|nr:DUF953 domain-containing protein [Planctomycetota bacterium]MDW8372662.1 DUF953 domain-containing protein [Planctomycetota bacterium]